MSLPETGKTIWLAYLERPEDGRRAASFSDPIVIHDDDPDLVEEIRTSPGWTLVKANVKGVVPHGAEALDPQADDLTLTPNELHEIAANWRDTTQLSNALDGAASQLTRAEAKASALRKALEDCEDVARAAISWAPDSASQSLNDRLDDALTGTAAPQ